MKAFSSVDLFFLIDEIKSNIENSRIESFYFENNIFYLKLFSKGIGHKFLTFKIGSYIYLNDKKDETNHPNPFISYLRKYLKNGFIESIESIEGERILKLKLSKKKDSQNENEEIEFIKYNMYIEIFSPGNVILTNSENIIINSLTKKNFKDRIVKQKQEYLLPPSKNLTLFNLDKLEDEIKNSDLSLVKFLALKFGMGSKYAEEIVKIAGLDKNQNVVEIEINKIKQAITKLIDSKRESYIKKENGEIKDFYPIKFSENSLEKTSSFNESILTYYLQFEKKIDLKDKEFEKDLKKLQNRLSKQIEQLEQVEKDYDKLNNYGNLIYENYSQVEEILNTINKAAKDKGWDFVGKVVKDSSDERLKIIKKIDYKNNKIILNL